MKVILFSIVVVVLVCKLQDANCLWIVPSVDRHVHAKTNGDDLKIPAHITFLDDIDTAKPRYRRYVQVDEHVSNVVANDEPTVIRHVRDVDNDDEESSPLEDFQEFVNELTNNNRTLKELHQIVNSIHFVHQQVRNTHQQFGQAMYEPRLQEIIAEKSKPVTVVEDDADNVDDAE